MAFITPPTQAPDLGTDLYTYIILGAGNRAGTKGGGLFCLLFLHAHRTTKYHHPGRPRVKGEDSTEHHRGKTGRWGKTLTGTMEIKSYCNEVNNLH